MSKRTFRRSRGRTAAIATAGAGVSAVVLFTPSADAATFTVTSLADDGSDGTLRKEIVDANAADGDDTIVFQAGLSGTIALSAAQGGDIVINQDSLDVQGPGADDLTVSGATSSRIFDLYGFDAGDDTVDISGLRLTGGDPYGVTGGDGGAVRSTPYRGYAPDLTIADSVLTGNRVRGTNNNGGAIAVYYGTFTITDSQITGNRAARSGGGLYTREADTVVRRTTLSGNRAAGVSGGGVYFLTLNDYGTEGLTIEASTLSDNTANNFGGRGGGLAAFAWTEPLTIEDSTISGNRGQEAGGGVYLYNGYDETGRISNSTIADNEAGSDGGGIFTYLKDNPGLGGAEVLELSSTIVADNTSQDGDIADQGAGADGSFALDFSLIEDPGDATYTETTAGSNITGSDPQLEGLAPAGGPTPTQVPGSASPALDAGIANGLTTDQRGSGFPRTVDLGVPNATGSNGTDIGAVERGVSEPTQTVIDTGPEPYARTNDPTPTFMFSSSNASPTFQCSLDQSTPSFGPCNGSGASHTPSSSLADGTWTFRVQDTSGGGDPTPATRTFTVDTDPPDTTIEAGPDEGAVIDDPTPTFGFNTDEPGSTFQCSVDTGTENWVPCSGPGRAHTPGELADGTYTFRVRAVDEAGNADPSPATRSFTVETPSEPPPEPPDDGGDGGDPGPPAAAAATCAGTDVARSDGTAGDDVLVGTDGTDALFGLDGDDKLSGVGGADCLSGDAGADALKGGGENDTLAGGAGNDKLNGGPGKDVIKASAGKDKINTADGKKDKLNCGGGKDKAKVDAKDKVKANCDVVKVEG